MYIYFLLKSIGMYPEQAIANCNINITIAIVTEEITKNMNVIMNVLNVFIKINVHNVHVSYSRCYTV